MKIRSVANDEHFTDYYYLSLVYVCARVCVRVVQQRKRCFRRFTPIFSNNMLQIGKIKFRGVLIGN